MERLRSEHTQAPSALAWPVPDEILVATVIEEIVNATVAQHLALNDGTLDTYPKIMDAVRSFVRASRGWNASAGGDSMDVDAMVKGKKVKGKGNEKGKSSNMRTKTQLTTSRTENVSNVRPKDTLQGTARRESTMRKPKLDHIVTTRRASVQV